MKKQMTLKRKLIIYFAGMLLLTLGIQAFINYLNSSKLIVEQVETSSNKSLKNMQEEIYAYINNVREHLDTIYRESDFIDDMTAGKDIKGMQIRYREFAHDFYLDHFNAEQGIVSFYIYDTSHECITFFRFSDTPIYKYPKDIYEDEEKYNSARVKAYIQTDEYYPMITSYYNENRECNIIRLVYKIYINNRSEVIGYFVCDVDEKVFRNIISKYTYSDEQIVCLQPVYDRPALIFGQTTDSQRELLGKIAGKMEEGDQNFIHESISHTKMFVQPIRKYNLNAYSIVPDSILKNEMRSLQIYICLASVVLLLICIVSAIFISIYLTKPLEELLCAIQRVKNGEKNVHVSVRSNDEIGKLSENFNTMIDQIETLITEEYEAQLHRKNAEYKALQAQINPHFLYNTLDTMSGIARMNQCWQVSELCIALSHLFRYSIDMKQPIVTIHQETAHLENYLYVMNVRMQNSIKVEIEIREEDREVSLPKMTLQPIVENAILHGLKNKRGEKEIRIYTHETGDDFFVIIEDNGVGMDTEILNKELYSENAIALDKGKSIGLININTRIRHVFGKEYGIILKSEPQKGCRVFIKIPRNGGKDGRGLQTTGCR